MASAIWYFFCDTCKGRRTAIKSKALALCYGCELLLCEECSRCHLKFKDHANINLIDLTSFLSDPSFYQTFSSLKSSGFVASELTSVYLDIINRIDEIDPLEKTQIQNLTGQEAFQRADPSRISKCMDFSVKQKEDTCTVHVAGLLCISDVLVVLDAGNRMLKLFDQTGKHLSSTGTMGDLSGISPVYDQTFATFCIENREIYVWQVRNRTIFQQKTLCPLHNFSNSIHFNGTFYCALHSSQNAVSVLDEEGGAIRMIHVKEVCEEKIELGLDIHMDSDTNNIYLPCYSEDGVFCMTIEGQALWFSRFSSAPQGIIEIHDKLYVADWKNGSIHLITKNGQYVKQLMNSDYGLIYMTLGMNNKLFACYNLMSDKGNQISVLKLEEDGERKEDKAETVEDEEDERNLLVADEEDVYDDDDEDDDDDNYVDVDDEYGDYYEEQEDEEEEEEDGGTTNDDFDDSEVEGENYEEEGGGDQDKEEEEDIEDEEENLEAEYDDEDEEDDEEENDDEEEEEDEEEDDNEEQEDDDEEEDDDDEEDYGDEEEEEDDDDKEDDDDYDEEEEQYDDEDTD